MRIGNFCSSACSTNAENAAPKLLEVSEEHDTFKSGTLSNPVPHYPWLAYCIIVAGQFSSTWKGGKSCPTVRKVYKIILSKALMAKYDSYKYVRKRVLVIGYVSKAFETGSQLKHEETLRMLGELRETRTAAGTERCAHVLSETQGTRSYARRQHVLSALYLGLLLIYLSSSAERTYYP